MKDDPAIQAVRDARQRISAAVGREPVLLHQVSARIILNDPGRPG
jgi:hypothetical protein